MAAIDQLLDIMARMRAEGGCPWDREQTLETLKQYLVEECYEVIDAIDSGVPAKHREELGDLLLQIVFQAQIRKEEGAFTFEDVARQVSEKLIRRHPHVFGDQTVANSEEVLKNWEKIKAREKLDAQPDGDQPKMPRSIVEGVPRHLPALHKAQHIQRRVARVGFDWTEVHAVMAKVEEELAEVKEALASGDAGKVKEEIGDLLFAVVNLSRFQDLNAEEALNLTVDKFVRRFQTMEARLRAAGRDVAQCTLAELDEQWDAVKAEE
jgi:tetrapyrrole methylase family protein/MazG family protein